MTIIQIINGLRKKKYNFLSFVDYKYLKVWKFSPIIFLPLLVIFTAFFFITLNFINKKNTENVSNLERIIKTNEFSNLTNFLSSKIKSPYQDINYFL